MNPVSNPSLSRHLLAGLALALLLGCGAAAARSGDTQQPVHVTADRAELRERVGTSHYQGNVIITQGSMRITADDVEVFSPNKTLQTIVARGQRATFDQTMDDGREVHAEALQMTYDARTRTILLEGDAFLIQAGNRLDSARIEYDLTTDQVRAGTQAPNERVEIIYQPADAPAGEPAP
jgi:lipopolysaccharide export system protein LptA